MTTILHVDSSRLGGLAVSRTLAAAAVAPLRVLHPDAAPGSDLAIRHRGSDGLLASGILVIGDQAHLTA